MEIKKIKVLNYEFDIIEKERIVHGGYEIGQIKHIEQQILIQSDISETRKTITLIHEVLHSVFQQLGYVDLHDNEQLITSLSGAFYQILKDNKLIK